MAGGLCQLEHRWLQPHLAARPSQPWLWVAPSVHWWPREAPTGRGVRLARDTLGHGYNGDVRCALPLPFPSESVSSIVLQHVTASDAEALIDECERVLMPGGCLWLTALNPFSPYRTRWRSQHFSVRTPQRLRSLLLNAGLQVEASTYLGPVWQPGAEQGRSPAVLRAACILAAEKRSPALPPPTPVPIRLGRRLAT